ncbi:putative actin-related protein 2/3 complex subunit 1A [Aspergillus welwitschiae]|uniref:Arp2/3 complex 41 kDa subunit n=1 Tax=Aspergillus welwitschiae TaxID=1341132 RepID=A0A3F3PYN5_9EURO|nr:putative actin-related protein 2/3 complex subunit 1A [Aspergillus welwitschiae]RDH32025.1 putative actin-related protein 2/3 complex subunit 1A [Aspergillus welwitschiae]
MAAPEAHHLFHNPIADHSFSPDKATLAVARENNVELYQKSGNKFSLTDELKGHEKTVTGVDIAPNSGRIVTCSQDRNAYVWERTPTGWKPTLVLLRINRAATFVRWSPSEQKFAVGSGARVIAVCYFEEENDWWISKHLKKPIRSTITTLAWHPNSVLLAAGSTDSHARVLSSFIKGVDTRPEPSAWGERLPFNTICGEFLNDSAGWIQGVSFSPSGDALAFTGHDSSVTVVYPSAPEQPPRAMLTIATRLLPFNSLIWNGENEIIAAGHDCEPYRLRGDENGWQLAGTIESKAGPGAGSAREESALNMFRQMDLKGQTQADTQLKTTHQNTISTVRVYEEADGVTWNTGPFLSDSCGYIAVSHSPSPNRIIVAFRGTYSITNTIVDLSAYPQAYVPYNTGHKNGKKEPSCYNCTVHAGFFTSWQNTRSTILDHVAAAREQYPDYKLVLVGHSLGGAVAALAGIEMQLRGWEPTVTTFGEPKVGNRAFADFLGKIFRLDENSAWRFRRVTHVYDPVPLLPLEEWGYAMHAGEIFISKEDLPPSVDDVHFCEGPRDARCISGEGGEMALAAALHERASLAADAKSQAGWSDAESTEQHNMPDGHISQTPLHVQEGAMKHRGLFDLPRRLIPSRYHLWELLFSHRDYFWRVGLCVPGRDRAGKGWWTSDS